MAMWRTSLHGAIDLMIIYDATGPSVRQMLSCGNYGSQTVWQYAHAAVLQLDLGLGENDAESFGFGQLAAHFHL